MPKDEKRLYGDEDCVEVSPTPILNLPDIKATKCIRPSDGSPYLIFYCEPTEKYAHGCPGCGSIDYVYNGTTNQPREIHDINMGIYRVDLILKVPKYRCKDCCTIFTHTFESVPEARAFTFRLYEQIRRDCFTRPFASVAAEFGYSPASIRNIFDEYAKELEAQREVIVAPEVLCIDEKHIVQKMRGVFVDCKTGRLLEMTEDNSRDTVMTTIEAMENYDTTIRIVTMDMANGYRSCIHECLPNAKIIVDKFHLYQDLNRKVAQAKKLIMAYVKKQIENETDELKKAEKEAAYNIVTHSHRLFQFSRKRIASSSLLASNLVNACKTFPEFNHLRLIKEGFESIYLDATDRASAEALYQRWAELIPPKNGKKRIAEWECKHNLPAALYSELSTFLNTTKSWYEEIFGYFEEDCQYTNASAEGINSLIQSINAQGAGYGFNRLRAKALYWSNVETRVTYSLDKKRLAVYSKGKKPKPFTKDGKTVTPDGYEDVTTVEEHKKAPRTPLSVFSYVDDGKDFYDFPDNEEDQPSE